MKSDKARKVTSREYIMKLIYQIEMNKEDIENIEERLDIFLNDNLEYIINRYEELRLQYSNNPNIELDNIELDDAVDREYMNIICKNLKENKDKIDELINKYAKNWSVNRMPKVDLSILRLAICELVFIEEIPSKVSINEAIELAKNGLDDEFKNMDKKEFIKYVGTICYIEPRCQDIYIIKRNRILSFKNDVKKLKEN